MEVHHQKVGCIWARQLLPRAVNVRWIQSLKSQSVPKEDTIGVIRLSPCHIELGGRHSCDAKSPWSRGLYIYVMPEQQYAVRVFGRISQSINIMKSFISHTGGRPDCSKSFLTTTICTLIFVAQGFNVCSFRGLAAICEQKLLSRNLDINGYSWNKGQHLQI